MQTLASTPEIEYTEPVYEIARPTGKAVAVDAPRRSDAPAAPFDDPMLGDQWHYNNTGRFSRSVAGADIGLFKAWKTETGKPNVIVAITDGGIDITHPDLKDNLYVNQKELMVRRVSTMMATASSTISTASTSSITMVRSTPTMSPTVRTSQVQSQPATTTVSASLVSLGVMVPKALGLA